MKKNRSENPRCPRLRISWTPEENINLYSNFQLWKENYKHFSWVNCLKISFFWFLKIILKHEFLRFCLSIATGFGKICPIFLKIYKHYNCWFRPLFYNRINMSLLIKTKLIEIIKIKNLYNKFACLNIWSNRITKRGKYQNLCGFLQLLSEYGAIIKILLLIYLKNLF